MTSDRVKGGRGLLMHGGSQDFPLLTPAHWACEHQSCGGLFDTSPLYTAL